MVRQTSCLILASLVVCRITAHEILEVNVNRPADELLQYSDYSDEFEKEPLISKNPYQEVKIYQKLADSTSDYRENLDHVDETIQYPETAEDTDCKVIVAEQVNRRRACTIGVNNSDLSKKQAIIVSPETNDIVLPSTTGEITIASGEALEMYCTEAFETPLSGKKIFATCIDGYTFSVAGTQVRFHDIQCTAPVESTACKTSRTCYNGAAILKVGFQLSNRFITLMELCHNFTEEVTHYSHYSLYSSAVAFQKSVGRIRFDAGGFYDDKNVNALYSKVRQMETIGKILGDGYEKYFNMKKGVYLSRGHLAAKADFIYGPAQLATFYFINAAPQWQLFNSGNWERVESGIRSFASSRNADLDVFSGTWGVLTLPDSQGVQRPLFLDFDRNNSGLIPVPKLYYRVIINKYTKQGIVLVGVNNPHATLSEIKKDYIICEDVSNKINWINWDKNNIKKGYSYACEVQEFTKKIGQLPALNVSGLLY